MGVHPIGGSANTPLLPDRNQISRLGEDLPFSGGLPSVDPLLEQGDALLVPRTVARHRAVADAVQDRVALAGDVVIRPEVDEELHRPAIPVAEQRLDVAVEADGLAAVTGSQPDLPSRGGSSVLRR